jgi:hypothetical protein
MLAIIENLYSAFYLLWCHIDVIFVDGGQLQFESLAINPDF